MARTGGGPATSFVGRRREIETLLPLVGEAPLVTLVGVGGVGKTRLAFEVAERAAGDAVVVELANARSPQEACATVLRSLAAGPLEAEASPDAVGTALDLLGAVLVVLDDLDGMVSHAAATIGRWLALAPRARFLCTSRACLGLPAEVVFELSPLELAPEGSSEADSDAVLLFIERARTVRAGRPLSADERADAHEIVRKLDGIPLAIELAVPQLRLMTTRQILSSLGTHLGNEAPGATVAGYDASPIWRAFDRSWQLLDEHERAMLAQLSVFSGGFSPELVVQVVRPPEDPGADGKLALLRSLRDKSLVHAYQPAQGPPEIRFSLYGIVRTYAAEKLGQTDERETRERWAAALHAAQTWSRRIDRTGDPDALARLTLEQENLVAIHRWALALRPMNQELATTALGAASLVAHAQEVAGGGWGIPGPLLGEALEVARVAGADPALWSRALLQQFRREARLGRLAGAEDMARQALQCAESAARRDLAALAEATLAYLTGEGGRFEEARLHQERALAFLDDDADPAVAHSVTECLVSSYEFEQRNEEAVALLRRVLRQHRAMGHRQFEGRVLSNLTLLLRDLEDWSGLRSAVDELLLIADSPILESACHLALAAIAQHEGRFDEARRLLERAIEAARPWPRRQSGLVTTLAMCELDAGDLVAARRTFEAVRLGPLWLFPGAMLTHAFLAVIVAGSDQVAEAESLLEQAASLAKSRPDLLRIIDSCRGHVELARARLEGDGLEAERLRKAAAGRLGAPHAPWRSRVERFAHRLLARALQTARANRHDAGPGALVVGSGWFRVPGGSRAEIRGRRTLRRVLGALARQRVESPGVALSAGDLFTAAWPGGEVAPDRAAGRVYAALSTLRKLGLEGLLISTAEGYLLDPSVPIELTG